MEQSKEVSRLKEEVSSLNVKIRWGQNKLKAETDTLKVSSSLTRSSCIIIVCTFVCKHSS